MPDIDTMRGLRATSASGILPNGLHLPTLMFIEEAARALGDEVKDRAVNAALRHDPQFPRLVTQSSALMAFADVVANSITASTRDIADGLKRHAEREAHHG